MRDIYLRAKGRTMIWRGDMLDFNLSQQPGSYYRSMMDAIKGVRPSYVPPGLHKIAGSLLESVHMRMEADIHKRDASTRRTFYGRI